MMNTMVLVLWRYLILQCRTAFLPQMVYTEYSEICDKRPTDERLTYDMKLPSCNSCSIWYSQIYFQRETTSFERPHFGGILDGLLTQVSLLYSFDIPYIFTYKSHFWGQKMSLKQGGATYMRDNNML